MLPNLFFVSRNLSFNTAAMILKNTEITLVLETRCISTLTDSAGSDHRDLMPKSALSALWSDLISIKVGPDVHPLYQLLIFPCPAVKNYVEKEARDGSYCNMHKVFTIIVKRSPVICICKHTPDLLHLQTISKKCPHRHFRPKNNNNVESTSSTFVKRICGDNPFARIMWLNRL